MSTNEEKPPSAAEALESAFFFVRRAVAFWKRAMLVFLVMAGVSVPMVFSKARNYRSETVVLYEEKMNPTLVAGGEGSGDNARRAAARLREMLLSRVSLEPIVKDTPRYNALAERRGIVDAVEELRSHITFRTRDGDTFEIGYEGSSPQEAQDITRRLGTVIVDEAMRRGEQRSKVTIEYLEGQSEANKAKLRIAESELWVFLGAHPEFVPQLQGKEGAKIVVVGGTPSATPAASSKPLSKDDQVLAALQAEEQSLQKQIHNGRADAPAAPVAPKEESEEVKAARKEVAEKSTLTELHPDLIAARRKLAAALEADRKKRAALAPVSSKLSDVELQALEARLAIVRRSIQTHLARHGAGGTVHVPVPPPRSPTESSTVTNEVEFRRLSREVENLKEAQKHLDDKLFQARLHSGTLVQVSIVDAAYLPVHPSSKPRSTTLALYIGLALALAILLAFISARLDDRIYASRDVELLKLLPVMGVIPREGKARS